MAFQRVSDKKRIAINLGSFVETQLTLLRQHAVARSLEDETRFQVAVLGDNLSLDDQLIYRQNQLRRVPKGDKEERSRIRKAISAIKNLVEQKEFQDAYLEELIALNDGTQNLDNTINWLNSRYARTTDQEIATNIRAQVKELVLKRYETQRLTLEKQTEYAVNDKTSEIIDAQITRVNTARVSAVQSENEDYIVLLDLQLQALGKAKTEADITNDLIKFSVANINGQTATSLLNDFNDRIAGADIGSAVTIGGIRYESAKEFWSLKQRDYLNDRSGNGFFPRYNLELNQQVDFKQTTGVLNNDSLADVKAWYDEITNRPELRDYQNQMTQDQQKGLKYAADFRSQSIINEFALKLDTQKAINDLAYLQDHYGVDQTTNYQKVILAASKEKEEQVRNLLSTMNQLIAANPGMSSQDALKQAVESGAGVVVTPEELATTPAEEVIQGIEEGVYKDEKITAGEEAEVFTSPNQLEEGGIYRVKNSSTVYRYENGQIHTFVGNWDEEAFKRATGGKGFEAIVVLDNITGVPTGVSVNSGDFPTPTAPSGAPQFQIPAGFEKIEGEISEEELKNQYSTWETDPTGTFLYGKRKTTTAEPAPAPSDGDEPIFYFRSLSRDTEGNYQYNTGAQANIGAFWIPISQTQFEEESAPPAPITPATEPTPAPSGGGDQTFYFRTLSRDTEGNYQYNTSNQSSIGSFWIPISQDQFQKESAPPAPTTPTSNDGGGGGGGQTAGTVYNDLEVFRSAYAKKYGAWGNTLYQGQGGELGFKSYWESRKPKTSWMDALQAQT